MTRPQLGTAIYDRMHEAWPVLTATAQSLTVGRASKPSGKELAR